MSAAEAYLENPDIPFNEMLTDQNFQIPVDFSIIGDGEYVLEVYAADTYGVKSETISRKVFISTTPPYTDIVSPEITRYNKKAIMMEGVSDDANGIEQVIISMDSGNTWQKAKMLEEKWRWELPLNTASYSDGIYSAMIRSIDKYGIVTFSNAMVNIDNTPPELYLNSPANGQHIGTVLSLAGRVADNVSLKNLQFQIISGEDPDIQENLSLPMRNVIDQSIDLSHFPQGEYIIRIAATDLADNQSMVSRKIFYDADDNAAQIAIFNPLPGEFFTGTVNIIGTVSSSFLPSSVNILMNGEPLINAPVDRYGVFMYEIPQDTLAADGAYTFSAFYHSQTGMEISSPDHTIYYSQYGPSLTIESHRDGDVITRRPWLSGRAEILIEQPEEGQKLSRRQKKALEPEILLVSYDNGRIFTRARGKTGWKFRMETSLLAPGPQPVVVKAIFADGKEAVRRAMLYVDTTLPEIAVVSPPENSVHRDNLLVYGTAGDNYELANVNVSLRPKNKFFYSVPSALQGLFVDVKTFGSTYFDVGLGLSFFNDNVRFQGQYGIAPPDGVPYGGRYVGHVFGIKLLANIFYLPFSALFGLDWEWLSMNLAVGANFSWFSMDTSRTPLFMSAVVAQLDVANIDFKVIKPGWKYFRNYAVYLEPELWFASSDVQAETIFRMTVGIRINIF
ncbi:MAG: hypothetical protein FWH41_03925 [Treponema sp.]|nr:hypothetical protein [Treponema sp.]